MTHGRHPRRARPINANPFGAALRKAARLTSAEIADTMAPNRLCQTRLREGAASEDHHELEAVRLALDWHEFQLRHVSAGELHAVAKKLIARTQSSGGSFVRRALEEIN